MWNSSRYSKTILTDEQLALLDKANNEDSENKVA